MQVSNPSKNEVDRIIGTVFIKPRKIANFGNFWEKKIFLRGRSAQIFFESKNILVTLFVYEISRKMVHKKNFYRKKWFLPKIIKISKSHNSLKIQLWQLKFCIQIEGFQGYYHAKNYYAKPNILENIAIFHFFVIFVFLVPFP